jgi:uncharacterized cofD-like protein
MELRSWRTWLRPGMLIKRWILLAMVGIIVISLGLAMGLTWAYRNYYWQLASTSGVVRFLTLQFIPHPYRELLLIIPGIGLLCFGLGKLGHAVIGPILALTSVRQPISQIVANHRFGKSIPDINVVAIGGGTGLSHLLRGLKQHDVDITAIVTVADDGGSTGRIRREYDMPAPGDLRNCIVALADDESLVSELFQYRFDRDGSDLKGHSLGNLFITALTQVTGSFEQAVLEFGKVVNIRGRVMPSTLENIDLCAELVDGSKVKGESKITGDQAPIRRVYLSPEQPAAYPPAIDAILNADLIILGPGSLYTSVIPNLLVSGVIDAVKWSRGTTVYACNVATQIGETDHFTATDHIKAVVEYLGRGNLDYAVVNSNRASSNAIRPELGVHAVLDDGQIAVYDGVKIVGADVISDVNPLRHDPEKLSRVLVGLTRPDGSVTPLPVGRIESRASEPLRI